MATKKEKLDLTGFIPREWTESEWLALTNDQRDLYGAKLKQFLKEQSREEERIRKKKEKLDLTGYKPREWTESEWLALTNDQRDLEMAKFYQYKMNKWEADIQLRKMKHDREKLKNALRTYIRFGGYPENEDIHIKEGKKKKVKMPTTKEILEVIADKIAATTEPEKIIITYDDVEKFNKKNGGKPSVETRMIMKQFMLDEDKNKDKPEERNAEDDMFFTGVIYTIE